MYGTGSAASLDFWVPGQHVPKGMGSLFGSDGRININAYRRNDVLPKDAWKQLDTAAIREARQELVGVADIRAAGLERTLDGIGVTQSQYERMGEMDAAELSMRIDHDDREDLASLELVSVPVPVAMKSFRLDGRTLDALRRGGATVDTTQAEAAGRQVAELLEETLFNGATNILVNGANLYGYTTEPNINPVSGSDWGTIDNIYADVNSAVGAVEADGYGGPYMLYVSPTQFAQTRGIYGDGSRESAQERVSRGIPDISAIRRATKLTDEAVLVAMRSDVVDMPIALDITTIQWDVKGGLSTRFRVLAVMTFRVKSTKGGNSGIAHITGI